jgi:hypothetical protein
MTAQRDQSLITPFPVPQGNQPVHIEFSLQQPPQGPMREVGIFAVDDAQGTIAGIAPGSRNYIQAALARATVIVAIAPQASAKPLELQRQLTLDPQIHWRFYVIENGTREETLLRLALGLTIPAIEFTQTSTEFREFLTTPAVTPALTTFELAATEDVAPFEPQQGTLLLNFANLNLQATLTQAGAVVGTAVQGQQELIDLRAQSGAVPFELVLQDGAGYENTFGLYIVDDLSGRIGELQPGDRDYPAVAIGKRVDLSQPLPGGTLLAPFIVSRGSITEFLEENPTNNRQQNVVAYFPFITANPDGFDHLILLGDNTFAFEDSFAGGDLDYNDVIAQVQLPTPESPTETVPSESEFDALLNRWFTEEPPVQAPSDVSVNQDDSLVAIAAWFDKIAPIQVYDREEQQVQTFTEFDAGLEFDPSADVLYLAKQDADAIAAYATQTWTELTQLPVSEIVPFTAERSGTMDIDETARTLFWHTASGTKMVELPDWEALEFFLMSDPNLVF